MEVERMQVVSVGYERRTLPEFVQDLLAARVRRVVDVRAVAMSRRADFRKAKLAAALEAAGIEYRHLPSAGNPFRKDNLDIAACLRAFRSHVDRSPEVLPELEKTLSGVRAAVLCYEREHADCHRSVLLDRLAAARPVKVLELH
jgi:uncharacterized protein (DUF488 family)